MAPLLEDPRFRQTWNNLSHNAETATESAATTLWTFTHDYISPCLGSIQESFTSCTNSCFSDHDERARRLRERGRSRGRAEYSFDFYDDWEEEEESNISSGLIGWGADEFDRLLAGSGSGSARQPSKKKGMTYGTGKNSGPRRKHTIDGLPADPTIIPSTSSLGFLQRLPWKLGGTLRYKPSAADMKDHPGRRSSDFDPGEEAEPLMDGHERSDNGRGVSGRGHQRTRSSTASSGETTNSFRSRGDLFPSDGEDDAVPLDDEFAMVLERRGTGLSTDGSSGKTKASKGKRVSSSRRLSRAGSRTTQSSGSRPPLDHRLSSTSGVFSLASPASDDNEGSSLADLQEEEERLKHEEDIEIQSKREAAGRLAAKRGLSITGEAFPTSKEGEIVSSAAEQELPAMDPSKREADADHPLTENIPDAGFVGAKLPRF